MTGDTVHPVLAEAADRLAVERLLQVHLRELSGYRTAPATDVHAYPYLDRYWTEPDRRAFLIRPGDQVAGFALVNAWAPSGLPVERAMAEFFIVPGQRRSGIGTRAAVEIIAGLPGVWEIGMLAAHGAAQAFWTHVLRQMPGTVPRWIEGDGRRWSGRILRFQSTGRCR